MLKRTLTGLFLAALTLAMLIIHPITRITYVGILTVIACHEMLGVLKNWGNKPIEWPGYVLTVVFCIQCGMNTGINSIFCTMLVILIGAMTHRIMAQDRTMKDVLTGILACVYPVAPMLFIVLLVSGQNNWWPTVLMSGAVSACMCDMFALFAGKLFGKHKLIPAISPNKTVEGLVGGLLFGTLSGIGVYFAAGAFGFDGVNFWVCLLSSAVCSLVSVPGDLAASAIKREAGIKDFGNLLPGHGGVMDRVDSMLFTIPTAYMVFLLTGMLA